MNIKRWPIRLVGEEFFFGYIVGIGVQGGICYGGERNAYALPPDFALWKDLCRRVWENMGTQIEHESMYQKVWIKLTPAGYVIDLP